jgi:hypothetical protein
MFLQSIYVTLLYCRKSNVCTVHKTHFQTRSFDTNKKVILSPVCGKYQNDEKGNTYQYVLCILSFEVSYLHCCYRRLLFRAAIFWDITRRRLIVGRRRFGRTYRRVKQTRKFQKNEGLSRLRNGGSLKSRLQTYFLTLTLLDFRVLTP